MKPFFSVVKIIAVVFLAAVLFFLAAFFLHVLRKFTPIVFRSEVESLISSTVYSKSELASEICGMATEHMIAENAPPPSEWRGMYYPWPKVKLLSWKPLFLMAGSVSARVTGVAVDHELRPINGQRCEAVLKFSFHFEWQDNGRSVNLHGDLTDISYVH